MHAQSALEAEKKEHPLYEEWDLESWELKEAC